MEKRPPIWRAAPNILNKQSRTADNERSSSLGLGEVLTTPHRKTYHVTKHLQRKPGNWTENLVRPKQRKRDKRHGTWNVRSLYRSGSTTDNLISLR